MAVAVSVVVPVHNTSRYLNQCVDSLIRQSLKDVEFIFVDDGSTDQSVNILEQYQKKDSRIKILKQKNQYAGVARNHGMEIATGKYIIFWIRMIILSPICCVIRFVARKRIMLKLLCLDTERFMIPCIQSGINLCFGVISCLKAYLLARILEKTYFAGAARLHGTNFFFESLLKHINCAFKL